MEAAGEGPFSALIGSVHCDECATEEKAPAREMELPRGLIPDIDGIAEKARKAAIAWVEGETPMITLLTSERGLAEPAAAWAAREKSRKERVVWCETPVLPACSAVLPDLDLHPKGKVIELAGQIKAHIRSGRSLIVTVNQPLSSIRDGIGLQVARTLASYPAHFV